MPPVDANHPKFTNPCVMVSCVSPGKPSVFHSSWSHLLCVLRAVSVGASVCEELPKKMKILKSNLTHPKLMPIKMSHSVPCYKDFPVRNSTKHQILHKNTLRILIS